MRLHFHQILLLASNGQQNLVNMKNIIASSILLFSLNLGAQNFQDELSSEISSDQESFEDGTSNPSAVIADSEAFEKAANDLDIPQRTFENLSAVDDGYYVVHRSLQRSRETSKTS